MTFSEASRLCLKQKSKDIKGQSRAQYESTCRLFSDFIGDKAIRLVTRKDAANFLEEVSEFDPHWGRVRAVKDLSFAQIKRKFGGHPEGLKHRTLNRYLTALSGVWKWAKQRGDVTGENPFSELHRPINKNTATHYTHFSSDDLTKLFAKKPAKRTLWEIPAVGLFSGMRLNEICSLQWGDVKEEDGILCFDINESKSEAGVRVVPIHSKLMWLLNRRSEDSNAFIWPELKPGGPEKKRSGKFTSEYTIYRRSCGIADKFGRYRKAFHSFRKNATRCLELARVPQTEAAEIIGHEKSGITYRVYNPEGLTMPMRREIVEKFVYPNLDLSHLIAGKKKAPQKL